MGKSIITVDNSATLRKMVSFILKGVGHTVYEAEDGAEAVRVIETNNIHIIITDLHMPNMNGLEFTKAVRAMPQHTKTPILFLTIEKEKQQKADAKAAGANGWIVKPFTPEQLLAIVSRFEELIDNAKAARA